MHLEIGRLFPGVDSVELENNVFNLHVTNRLNFSKIQARLRAKSWVSPRLQQHSFSWVPPRRHRTCYFLVRTHTQQLWWKLLIEGSQGCRLRCVGLLIIFRSTQTRCRCDLIPLLIVSFISTPLSNVLSVEHVVGNDSSRYRRLPATTRT